MATEFVPQSSMLRRKQPKSEAQAEVVPVASKTAAEVDSDYRLHRRFDRMGRLIGDGGMQRLFASHVMVIGQGGVGSWTAEALVRSGVGKVTIVDFDLVCVTNANRQLHAMRGTTGKPKVEIMGERLQAINPRCEVVCERAFYNAETSARLLALAPDLIVDAIDNLTAKTHLISTCHTQGIPLVVSGGASGRMDPTQIRVSDMTKVQADPFVAATRKILRQRHQMAREGTWGIATVHSLERPHAPQELHYDNGEGFRCVCPQGQNNLHSCEHRNVIYGTAGFVTGSFGLACAAEAVRQLLGSPPSAG
ncbi:MAG: tRNA threonylcarbamoyladenosine dehydratase [Nannocystaceae bacterium]